MIVRRLILVFAILAVVLSAQPTAAAGVWGSRPLLSYFALKVAGVPAEEVVS